MKNDFAIWFDHLRILCPPTGVVLVGAGTGTSDWVQRLVQWETPNVTLIEADDAQFQHLQRSVPQNQDWRLRKQVIARDTETVNYHQASNVAESGLLEPETLRSLWPNIKTRQNQSREAVALSELLQDTDAPANWLLVDCLPALAIIQGATNRLDTLDVIAARVLLDETALPDGMASQSKLQSFLESLGFRCVAIEAGRHPAIGHVLFVRDTAAQAQQLQQQFAHQAETLAQAKAAAAEREQQIERLKQAAAQAQVAAKAAAESATASAAAAAMQAEERAAQAQQLTQAKAAAEKLAAEREQQIEGLVNLQKKLDQAVTDAATELHAQKLAREKLEIAFKQIEQNLEATKNQRDSYALIAKERLKMLMELKQSIQSSASNR